MIAFYESELGQRAIGLEISARAGDARPRCSTRRPRDRAAQMRSDGDPRYVLLERFAEANDLFESNVAGALNSNYAFYPGLAEAGALGHEMDESAILSEVWSQEAAGARRTPATGCWAS